MDDAAETRPLPWRKRHPVLSRSILYVLGLGLAVILLLLYLERREQNRRDHLAYLEARLSQLDLISSGEEVLAVLDEEFSDPDLPAYLRHRAWRARAVAHADRGEFDQAFSALAQADALAQNEVERLCARIERALVMVRAGQAAEAQAILELQVPPDQLVLLLWRAMALADVHAALERAEEAAAVLHTALEALSPPLPPGPPVPVTLTPWTPATAAHLATRRLVAMPGRDKDGEPWRRLLELAPGDFDAAVAAAGALFDLGFMVDAQAAWRRAVALSPDRAAEAAAANPDLQDLSKLPR